MPINSITVVEKPDASFAKLTDKEEISSAVDKFNVTQRALGYSTFQDILPNVSIRQEYDRQDYEYYRPGSAIPKRYSQIIKAVDQMYYGLGIVRNIVDLMSDFSSQGIRLVHPVKTQERFFRDWFDQVNGAERSERFLSYLYRHGMVVSREMHGTISVPNSDSFADSEYKIPLKYIFINPGLVQEEPRDFVDGSDPQYFIRINPAAHMVSDEFDSNVTGGTKMILPADRTYIEYYKKDDWQKKPYPFLYPLIKHAIALEKLNLADMSALDGAISKVRIFKLGSLDHKIYPTARMAAKLDELLQANTGAGTIDLIWGPDIELIESKTDVHEFLGEDKYKPHLSQIYDGLGISSGLVGAGSGTTNNYISLKVMMKRLISGREKLIKFWKSQIRKVQLEMGFAQPAEIEFDHLNIGDEESERTFLMNLLDRNVISEERLHNIIGSNYNIEKKRLIREQKERDAGRRLHKTSPYHDPQFDISLKKIALQRGYITMKQAGVEVPEAEQETPFDMTMQKNRERFSEDKSNKGGPGGRPQGAKDKEKRKTRVFKPALKAKLDFWASSAQRQISEVVNPAVLESLQKKSMRELTLSETNQCEIMKFGVLCSIKPFSQFDKEDIVAALNAQENKEELKEYKLLCSDLKKSLERNLTAEEKKSIQQIVYQEKNYEQICD